MISKERQLDLLVGALEGGSNYWYELGDLSVLPESGKSKPIAERIFDYAQEGGEIEIFDIENSDEKVGVISKATMDGAIEKMLGAEYEWAVGDILSEDDDADTADIWFQFVVMGEVVFS
jgi:hypothetical protein